MKSVPELFGSMVFGDAAMRERLPKETYKALRKTIQDGKKPNLDITRAHTIALSRLIENYRNGVKGEGETKEV